MNTRPSILALLAALSIAAGPCAASLNAADATPPAPAAAATSATPAAPAPSPFATELGDDVAAVPVPVGTSKDAVQDAIVRAFRHREWGIRSKEDGKVVAYLMHRANEATITMVYDTKEVTLFCVGYKVDKATGKRIKPELPNGWIKYLRKDLTEYLGKSDK